MVDDTQSFLTSEEVLDSTRKTETLESAGQSCLAVLKEVDDFLDKHAQLAGKTKRLIDTMRFLKSDVEGLKKHLDLNTQLLQLALISFQRRTDSRVYIL